MPNMHIRAYVKFSRCGKSDNDIYLFPYNYFLSGILCGVLCGALLCSFVICQVPEMWPNQRVVAFDKQQKLSNNVTTHEDDKRSRTPRASASNRV